MQSDFTIIQNGRVIDPASKTDQVQDVLIKHGQIVDYLSDEERQHANTIDASGKLVTPGLIDIHVHFRDPGQTHKEDTRTGSQCAAAGGFTQVVAMPNTAPVLDSVMSLEHLSQKAERDSLVKIHPSACLTKNREGKTLAPLEALKAQGAVAFTDDGDCIQSTELMFRACQYAADLGIPVLDHCQEATLTQGSVMHEGPMSLKLGLKGWPRLAEDLIVERNILIARETGAHIHMQHITSGYAVELIRRAKQDGINVTAEATPHHLALTDEAIGDFNTNFKMNPPLREESDRQALIAGVLDGTLEILATDHAPHTVEEKNTFFDNAPFGILGLETAFSIYHQILVEENKLALIDLIDRMSTRPAKLFKLPGGSLQPGSPADVTLIDLDASWTYTTTYSKSQNSPWWGATLKGRVAATLVDGKVVFALEMAT